jgi:hypothetical protein
MSDFLTNIASRAVSAAPPIRPLVPSVFEPPAVDEAMWPATQPQPGVREIPSPPLVSRAAPPSLPEPGSDSTDPQTETGPQQERLFQATSTVPENTHSVTPVRAVIAAPARRLAIEAESQSLRADGSAPAEPVMERPSSSPKFSPTAVTPMTPVNAVARIPEVVIETTPPGAGTAAPEIAPISVRTSIPRPHDVELRPTPDAAQQFSHDRTSARAATPTYPQPEPVVTITIGRVEIRAAAPAARESEPPPKAAGPPLSLETYLRRSASRSA